MLLGASHAALANGVITIVGSLSDSTCRIENQDPPYHLLVRLPKVGGSSLRSINDTAGDTRFRIRLTDCPDSMNGQTVRAYFEHGATTNFGTDNLIAYTPTAAVTAAQAAIPGNAGTPYGPVQIQIANMDGSQVRLGKDQADQGSAGFNVTPLVTTATDGSSSTTYSAELNYLARYVKVNTNPITGGHLVSYVRYSIVYP